MNRRLDPSLVEELLSVKDGSKQSTLGNLIADRRLSLRTTRKLLRDVSETDRDLKYESDYIDHIKIAERSFDK
jgi:hypothetical protein